MAHDDERFIVPIVPDLIPDNRVLSGSCSYENLSPTAHLIQGAA
jgi:hypothetical protein